MSEDRTQELIRALREKAAGKTTRFGDAWGDWICERAAAEIERLRAELAECRGEMAERDGAGLGERGA